MSALKVRKFDKIVSGMYKHHVLTLKEYYKSSLSTSVTYVMEVKGSQVNVDIIMPVTSFQVSFQHFVQNSFDKTRIMLDNILLERGE